MLIFGLPPSDPAPEFEPGLNLGSNPPPYLDRILLRQVMVSSGSKIR